MAGKQPRTTRRARQGADDGHGLVGQQDMARLAGFGQRHGEQALIQAYIFPAGLENFAFARAGEQKQPDGRRLGTRRALKRPHEPPGLRKVEAAFPLEMDFEGGHARAGRLPGGQHAVQHGQGADAFEDGQIAVAGGRAQTLGRQIVQPVFHLAAPDAVQPPGSESRRKTLPGNAFIHLPAPLAKFDVRQIDGGDKGVELQNVGRADCGRVLCAVLGHTLFSCKNVMKGQEYRHRAPAR